MEVQRFGCCPHVHVKEQPVALISGQHLALTTLQCSGTMAKYEEVQQNCIHKLQGGSEIFRKYVQGGLEGKSAWMSQKNFNDFKWFLESIYHEDSFTRKTWMTNRQIFMNKRNSTMQSHKLELQNQWKITRLLINCYFQQMFHQGSRCPVYTIYK